MKDILTKFEKGGQLVGDLFAKALTTEIVHFVTKILHFFGCRTDLESFNVSVPAVVQTFSRQILHRQSDFTGSAIVGQVAQRYMTEIRKMIAKERNILEVARAGMPPTQSIPRQS